MELFRSTDAATVQADQPEYKLNQSITSEDNSEDMSSTEEEELLETNAWHWEVKISSKRIPESNSLSSN